MFITERERPMLEIYGKYHGPRKTDLILQERGRDKLTSKRRERGILGILDLCSENGVQRADVRRWDWGCTAQARPALPRLLS